MQTQRINAYTVDDNRKVYFIEQYNPEVKDWFTVGSTFDKYEYAEAQVNNQNIKELLDNLTDKNRG